MTAHELARKLLEGPDVLVGVLGYLELNYEVEEVVLDEIWQFNEKGRRTHTVPGLVIR